jgi:hypothetical protein
MQAPWMRASSPAVCKVNSRGSEISRPDWYALVIAAALLAPAAEARAQVPGFSFSGTRSAPLPPEQVTAVAQAMRFLELAASCRHVLTADNVNSLRLAGWDALVGGGYEPKGATEALRVIDQLNATVKPGDDETCRRTSARALRGISR